MSARAADVVTPAQRALFRLLAAVSLRVEREDGEASEGERAAGIVCLEPKARRG